MEYIVISIFAIIVFLTKIDAFIRLKKETEIEKKVKEYMKLPYTIKLIPEYDGTWFVEIEELPGCMSEGDTPEEALIMIKDAMKGWLESCIERGIEIPLPKYAKEVKNEIQRNLEK